MLRHECYSWSKRISWRWIFWHFCFARQCTMRSNTENGSKKGLLYMYVNMQRSQPISGAWKGPWPADPPSNYSYLKCISMLAVLGGFLVFGHISYNSVNTYISIFYHGRNGRMLWYGSWNETGCVLGKDQDHSLNRWRDFALCLINP